MDLAVSELRKILKSKTALDTSKIQALERCAICWAPTTEKSGRATVWASSIALRELPLAMSESICSWRSLAGMPEEPSDGEVTS